MAAAQEYTAAALQWFDLEQYDRAKELLLRAIELYPEQVEARILLAQIYVTEGDVDDAFAQVRVLPHRDSGDEQELELLAYVYAASGELDLAKPYYEKLTELRDRAVDWCNLAIIYHAQGNVPARDQALSVSLSIDPEYLPAVEMNVAILYEREQWTQIVLELRGIDEDVKQAPYLVLYSAMAEYQLELYPEFFENMSALIDSGVAGFSGDDAALYTDLLRNYARGLVDIAISDERAEEAYRAYARWLELQKTEAEILERLWQDEQLFLEDHEKFEGSMEFVTSQYEIVSEQRLTEAVEGESDQE